MIPAQRSRIPALLVLFWLALMPISARGGTVRGTVRSFVSGLPVAASVELLDSNGGTLDTFTTGADGNYQFTGLAAGGYHLMANFSSEALAVEFWPDVICYTATECQLGQVVTVNNEGTTTADFSLDTLGMISGRMVDAETGAPVGGGRVLAVLFVGGVSQGSDGADVNPNGEFQILGMTPGTWKLVSQNHPDHIEKVFGGDNCEVDCDTSTIPSGTFINTQLNQASPIGDFGLSFGPGLSGWARREGTATTGLAVDVFNQAGSPILGVTTNTEGRFRIRLDAGTYYLATDNGPGFIDQIYNQVPCPDGPASQNLCNPLDGDPLTVNAAEPAVGPLVFDLVATSSLFRDSFETGDFSAWSLVFGN